MVGSDRVVVTFTLLLFLSTFVSGAVHTVEDLYNQGDRTHQAVNELRKELNDIKSSFEGAITSKGTQIVLIILFLFVAKESFFYLGKVAWFYWNRRFLRRQRDSYVKRLQQSNQLLVEQVNLLKEESELIKVNLNNLQNLLGKEFSIPKHNKPFFSLGIILLLAGIPLIYFGYSREAGAVISTGIVVLIAVVFSFFFKFTRAIRYIPLKKNLTEEVVKKTILTPKELGTTPYEIIEKKPERKSHDVTTSKVKEKIQEKKEVGKGESKTFRKNYKLRLSIIDLLDETSKPLLGAEIAKACHRFKDRKERMNVFTQLRKLKNENKIISEKNEEGKNLWRLAK